jgi:hypothetical protein
MKASNWVLVLLGQEDLLWRGLGCAPGFCYLAAINFAIPSEKWWPANLTVYQLSIQLQIPKTSTI